MDRIVESITVSKGVSIRLNAAERKAAITKYFDPKEGFGNWLALHLGSELKEVLDNLGEPKEKQKGDRVWIYESACSCEIPNELSVEFRDGKIIELVLFAED